MPIHAALHHRTCYRYDRSVGLSPHLLRLRPAPHTRTPILSYSLKLEPAEHFLNWQQDPHANYLARLVFPKPARELLIEVDLVAELSVQNPFDFFLEPDAERYPFSYDSNLARQLAPYLETPTAGPRFEQLVDSARSGGMATVDYVVALNRRVHEQVSYIIRLEPGVQRPEQTLELGSGSCRDSAWLLVQVLRRLGLAARFVSGYLIQLTPDVQSLDGPSGPATDFTDLHAWTEVYLPGAGWVGLDPTSGLLAGEGHIPLACTPDPRDAAPVTGTVDPCESSFFHEMRVWRIFESPRVTKPYTESQWQAIQDLGASVDADLQAHDVRLTMGGEPTFVSLDDYDSPEWNFTALGAQKRELAGALIKRLRHRFAPGGLLFYGQGKLYPGESLPRWALACYWRRDGLPIWEDENLIADETRSYGHDTAHSLQFLQALARNLGLVHDLACILPAYEDVWYHLWKERRLPINVDPLQSQLDDPEERARLARVFEHGLGQVVGHVLPLNRRWTTERGSHWVTGPWFLRAERLFLLPGDSPIGFRLPLSSLPWAPPHERPPHSPPDPMQDWGPLPRRADREDQLRLNQTVRQPTGSPEQGTSFKLPGEGGHSAGQRSAPDQSAAGVVRQALCVEPRHGRLHVFLPPVDATEDFLELISAIERTAREEGMAVIIEGTPPPWDPRLRVIKVTPDPGVIEVNLHPAANWRELVDNTTILYEEARQSRLGTEKFMLDGRHSGTGGGNHIVIGGPAPADSPLLRRPDLLRSLLAFWQNHPSLSYCFSSLFLGPTSQHPRIDEARHDSLHELELAFQQVPRSATCPPWLVDRIFRHLLVDVTGNTHRTEFCIDKLYAPESASGRLGLLELRSFEMPPHARMSLAQHLLLRALIAHFWRQPYQRPLARWGTDLHDRFLLPHFLWEDLAEVIEHLRSAGYPLQLEWFGPHFEFRFPRVGAICPQGVQLELRTALEPWHVLGEEPGGGGTVRYVDSSLERLQVKVFGLTESRHAVACNGFRVPLHSTGTSSECVAGVRYRAWQPPTCLHPTIGVHSPLVFDVVDLWNGRSVGGCTYHVMHPGGRNYSRFPVNAYEAESRRLARFHPFGHTPGPLQPRLPTANPDFPFTLDLRRT
jgi:uncharacterized protein (DUF2126 family)